MADVSGRCSIGKRENQEDAFEIVTQSEVDPASDLLIIVSDGMGGHVGGEIASNLGVAAFKNHFISGSEQPKVRDRLLSSMHSANKAIADRIATDPAVKGMGCTLIGAIKHEDKLSWASVGDSHIYLLRDKALRKLNADHSVYGELTALVTEGKITQQEADSHPKKNALRSAIVGGELSLIDLDAAQLKHGDVVIVATDGLDTVSPNKIESLLAGLAKKDAETISSELLNAVADVGYKNQDNTTIVAYRHRETGRSALSPDRKWGVPVGSKDSNTTNVTKIAYLIAGLCGLAALAVLIGVLAFRPNAETPSAVIDTPSQIETPVADTRRETDIGADGGPLGTDGRQIGDDGATVAPIGEPVDPPSEIEDDLVADQEAETPIGPSAGPRSLDPSHADGQDPTIENPAGFPAQPLE